MGKNVMGGINMINKRFDNKIAFVTGASSGIGLAITKKLIEEGAQVAGFARTEEKLKKIEEEYKDKFFPVAGDATNPEDVKKAVEKTVRKFGRIDTAFNVAGSAIFGTVIDQEIEDWKYVVDLCLNGMFYSIKYVANEMKKQGNGTIVNITSLNSHVPMYAGASYSSAKAGAEMLTKNAAIELAPYNIRVNAILPGLVATPLSKDLTDNEELNAAYMERIPAKRAAQPEEIAGPSLFLASEEASYINGASLVVDAGWEQTGYPDLSKFLET